MTSEFSPHAWGWTAGRERFFVLLAVFPTRVGVDRRPPRPSGTRWCFPHTRGGGPPKYDNSHDLLVFSPHAWGWTERD